MLLENEQNQKYIAENLELFFAENKGSTQMSTVWEASKAFIRGRMIALASKKKKEDRIKVELLEQQVFELETSIAKEFSETKMQQLCKLKSRMYELYNDKIEMLLLQTRTTYYEEGDKI